MCAAIDGDLVDSVEVRDRGLSGDSAAALGGGESAGVCNLVYFGDRTTRFGGGRRDQLLVDIPPLSVVNTHAQPVAQKYLGGPAETHTLPVPADSVPGGGLFCAVVLVIVGGEVRVGGLAGGDLRVGAHQVLDGNGAAAHVALAPGALVFLELPLAEKAEGAHAEGQDGRHLVVHGEEAGSA